MNKKILTFTFNLIILFSFFYCSNSPYTFLIIPYHRKINWTPGITWDFPAKNTCVNIKSDFNAEGDGITNDYYAFQSAINSLPTDGGIIYIPDGTYLLTSTLIINKGVILRGNGYNKTYLEFDLGSAHINCIEITQKNCCQWIDILSGYSKGSREIILADTSSFTIGDFIEIKQDNDPELMYTNPYWKRSWSEDAVGQVFIIKDIISNTIKLNKEIYFNYSMDKNPKIRNKVFVEYAGIENLHIKRIDDGNGHTIQIKNAAYININKIESEYTGKAHICLEEAAYRCEITENYFHLSHDYGNIDGCGYGVQVGKHSTDCLIENNIFINLRHSIVIHIGASGNVISYNYSSSPLLPRGQAGSLCDISLHGHFTNNNLFESNVVTEIDISDYWGPCGPGNTFLRNKIQNEGLEILDHSHQQNIIGNVLGNGWNIISVDLNVRDTILHGNFEKSELTWDSSIYSHDIPESYYLTEKPSFLRDKDWPIIGSNLPDSGTLPAQDRFEQGVYIDLD